MEQERNWVQETIDIRKHIDAILKDQTATDTDLKGLAENVTGLWRVWGIDSKRINALERQVATLRTLAVVGLLGLALGVWWLLR